MNTEKTAVDCYAHGARYYDPQLSLWHTVDPLSELYSGYSPYHYVANNPVNFIDPNGMSYGPSQDERDKINEGAQPGAQLGSGLRRMNFYSNVDQMYLEYQLREIFNSVSEYMPDNGAAVINYSDDIMTVLAPVVGSLPGQNYFSINGFLEYTYKNVGGRFRSLNVNGHYGSQSSAASDSAEEPRKLSGLVDDLITLVGASSSTYANHLKFLHSTINKHYTKLYPKYGTTFGVLGNIGDIVATVGAGINLRNELKNPESWTDMATAIIGWWRVVGDVNAILYMGTKDQVYQIKENIHNDVNPLRNVYVPATGDVLWW